MGMRMMKTGYARRMMAGAVKGSVLAAMTATTALSTSMAANAETLKEALAAAYESNPQLDAQRAALRVTDEGVRRAKANYFPTITGNYNRREAEQRTFVVDQDGQPIDRAGNPIAIPPFVGNDNENYSLTADQNVFRGLRTHNEIQQAKANVSAGRAQLIQVEQTVLLDGVTAYMDVLRDESVRELNENNVQVLDRQLQASRDRFRVGEITRTDVAQSEARLEGAKAQLSTSEAQLAASRATYERVIGRAPASLEHSGGEISLPPSLEDAVELAVQESPAVDQARHAEYAARKGIHVAEGQLAPTVTLRAQISENIGTTFVGEIPVDLDNVSRAVTLNVSVPLYAGGANYSDIRRAKQLRSQRMLEIRQAERETQERVLTAWNQYRAAQAQILSRQAAVDANEIALDGVRQEAQVGSRTTLDVLDAEQELLDSRVNLVRAQRDETVAAYTLLSAMGQLTARKLGLGVTLYNPDDNYKRVRTKIIGW